MHHNLTDVNVSYEDFCANQSDNLSRGVGAQIAEFMVEQNADPTLCFVIY